MADDLARAPKLQIVSQKHQTGGWSCQDSKWPIVPQDWNQGNEGTTEIWFTELTTR